MPELSVRFRGTCAEMMRLAQAFPPTLEGGSQNYQVCLQYLDGSCQDTCAAFK